MANADIITQIQVNQDLKEPPMFKIIYLNDNATLDNDTVAPVDTAGSDLNRTVPYIALSKPLVDTESPTDSGGQILFNPYVEAGWFLNDGGSYVGVPTTFTG